MSEAAMDAFIDVADDADIVRRSRGFRGPAPAAPVQGLVPATGLRRAWPAADLLLVLIGGAGLAVSGWPWLAALLVPAAVAAILISLTRWGVTPAHLLLTLRTVEQVSALPPSVRDVARGRLLTADRRRGRDPLQIVPGRVTPVPVPRIDPWAPNATHALTQVILVLDDGTRVTVDGPSVLGRRPDPRGSQALIKVTDLSRTLSRNHVMVAPHRNGLEVTDLGSVHGTLVAHPGEPFTVLPAGASVVAPPGSRVRIGARLLVVADPSASVSS